MKRLMTALTLIITVAGIAPASEEKPVEGKDLCVLQGLNCPDRFLTIQEKLGKLKAEIAKGTQVYTPEELRRLEHKLRDLEGVWDFLN